MHILILGGTAEARLLADRLAALGHDVTTSLAGRTQNPVLPAGTIRMGGFGGATGLDHYLRDGQFDFLVDATHPYAARISDNAVTAAASSGVPLLRLMRPQWRPAAAQKWVDLASAEDAARFLTSGARVLLTTGHTGLEHFLMRSDCRFFVRVIEPPDTAIPHHAELIVSRPPYGLAAEAHLLDRHGITHLVSKNSGGTQTAAKLEAARRAGVEVVMIARPPYRPAPEVSSVEEALDVLTGRSRS